MDVKPANILLDNIDCRVAKLADLGVSRYLVEGSLDTITSCGVLLLWVGMCPCVYGAVMNPWSLWRMAALLLRELPCAHIGEPGEYAWAERGTFQGVCIHDTRWLIAKGPHGLCRHAQVHGARAA